MVQGLEERLNQLRPLLRQNQLEAVDAAPSLNAGRLATARTSRPLSTGCFFNNRA